MKTHILKKKKFLSKRRSNEIFLFFNLYLLISPIVKVLFMKLRKKMEKKMISGKSEFIQ